ncbi:helix-turn-helix domain-containing protein, partial [Desertihabitans aurantiacus]|uniref:helix-turn-helix domain-containing protein n=1 Tax=Desertihabitans aurantiacus TaxID=2282477 RepID=UPI00130051F3
VLPEPARDASGYRRYAAADVAALVRVRALAAAGVPLADVPGLLAADPASFRAALATVEQDLLERIEALRAAHEQLRRLTGRPDGVLPPGVGSYLDQLRRIGLSEAWVAMEADLWVMAHACYGERAAALLEDQRQAKTDPSVQQLYLDFDRARDLPPDDPQVRALADRVVAATLARYPDRVLPVPVGPDPVADLLQEAANAVSPAWRRVDALVRRRLEEEGVRGR